MYHHSDGTEYNEHDTEVIARFEADIESGEVFARHHRAASSNRFCGGYQAPLSRRAWSHYTATVGQMAARSDALAQVAAHIIGVVNLYGTNTDALAQVHAAVLEVMSTKFDDVLLRSGPEAPRHSATQFEWTLTEKLQVILYVSEAVAKFECSVPCIGWCLDAVLRKHHIVATHGQFPSLVKAAS